MVEMFKSNRDLKTENPSLSKSTYNRSFKQSSTPNTTNLKKHGCTFSPSSICSCKDITRTKIPTSLKKNKTTPSSINKLFPSALLSAPSGSGWHISSLEPQTGAKDESNLLTHLSLSLFRCFCLPHSLCLSSDSLHSHQSLHLQLQLGETIRAGIFTEAGV